MYFEEWVLFRWLILSSIRFALLAKSKNSVINVEIRSREDC